MAHIMNFFTNSSYIRKAIIEAVGVNPIDCDRNKAITRRPLQLVMVIGPGEVQFGL